MEIKLSLIICFIFVNYSQSIELKCNVTEQTFGPLGKISTCEVSANLQIYNKNDAITDPQVKNIQGLLIQNKKMFYLPLGIENYFTMLKVLKVTNSELKEITTENMIGFPKLRYLDISSNKIEKLEFNLFIFNPELCSLIFFNNQISMIDPMAFNGLKQLTFLDLRNNTCISKVASNKTDTQKLIKSSRTLCWIDIFNVRSIAIQNQKELNLLSQNVTRCFKSRRDVANADQNDSQENDINSKNVKNSSKKIKNEFQKHVTVNLTYLADKGDKILNEITDLKTEGTRNMDKINNKIDQDFTSFSNHYNSLQDHLSAMEINIKNLINSDHNNIDEMIKDQSKYIQNDLNEIFKKINQVIDDKMIKIENLSQEISNLDNNLNEKLESLKESQQTAKNMTMEMLNEKLLTVMDSINKQSANYNKQIIEISQSHKNSISYFNAILNNNLSTLTTELSQIIISSILGAKHELNNHFNKSSKEFQDKVSKIKEQLIVSQNLDAERLLLINIVAISNTILLAIVLILIVYIIYIKKFSQDTAKTKEQESKYEKIGQSFLTRQKMGDINQSNKLSQSNIEPVYESASVDNLDDERVYKSAAVNNQNSQNLYNSNEFDEPIYESTNDEILRQHEHHLDDLNNWNNETSHWGETSSPKIEESHMTIEHNSTVDLDEDLYAVVPPNNPNVDIKNSEEDNWEIYSVIYKP